MRKVNTTIKYIEPYSIAEDAGIEVGDKLISINGHDFHDILEYRYLTAEYDLLTRHKVVEISVYSVL